VLIALGLPTKLRATSSSELGRPREASWRKKYFIAEKGLKICDNTSSPLKRKASGEPMVCFDARPLRTYACRCTWTNRSYLRKHPFHALCRTIRPVGIRLISLSKNKTISGKNCTFINFLPNDRRLYPLGQLASRHREPRLKSKIKVTNIIIFKYLTEAGRGKLEGNTKLVYVAVAQNDVNSWGIPTTERDTQHLNNWIKASLYLLFLERGDLGGNYNVAWAAIANIPSKNELTVRLIKNIVNF